MECYFCHDELISKKNTGAKGWRRHFCPSCGSFIQESPEAIAMETSNKLQEVKDECNYLP